MANVYPMFGGTVTELHAEIGDFVHKGEVLAVIRSGEVADYEKQLKEYLKDKRHHVEFLGKKSFEEIVPYLKECLCTVVPSEWYDNFPNVILESFAYKKAVIATDFGSLPELVHDNKTGLTFQYADIECLKEKIRYTFEHPETIKEMGENGYQSILSDYSPSVHYTYLINLFDNLKK